MKRVTRKDYRARGRNEVEVWLQHEMAMRIESIDRIRQLVLRVRASQLEVSFIFILFFY